MDRNKITRYLIIREELQDQYNTLLDQIAQMERQIAPLLLDRDELAKLLFDSVPTTDYVSNTSKIAKEVAPVKRVTYNGSHSSKLVEFLQKNPGSNRQDIDKFFGGKLEAKNLSNVINSARRRGLIENRGTRVNSSWHLVNGE